MGSVFDAVSSLRAVREFDGRELDEAPLRRILGAARLTASASNRQPWKFVVVRGPDRLRELAALLSTGPYTAQAGAAVIVGYEKGAHLAVADASRAIQSMVLVAWDEGIASNWVGFAGMDEVRRFAGLSDEYDVLGVLPFGYPAKPVKPGKKRKPWEEVVSGL